MAESTTRVAGSYKIDDEGERPSKVDGLLMLLGSGGRKRPAGGRRVFECKTCGRRFPTFQALGGHRTSHKRTSTGCGKAAAGERAAAGTRVHGCPVCKVEFHMGQALGGHMRRHKLHDKKQEQAATMLFDLNLPPPMPMEPFFWEVPMIHFL